MNKIQQGKLILSGLANFIKKDKKIELLVKKRMPTCLSCQQFFINRFNSPKCKECGCLLKLKLRSPNAACPLNKWTTAIEDADYQQLIADLEKNEL